MAGTLDRAQIRTLLAERAARMAAAHLSGGVRVVGGAAIALMSSDRRATADIDAQLLPAEGVRTIAAQMADEYGLGPDWVNEAAAMYVPPVGSEDWIPLMRMGDVVVSLGSAPMLLAMKLSANRGRRDAADIDFLLDACNVTSVEEAQSIYERYHAQDVLPESAQARVRAWLRSRDGAR
ncbi:MAG: DUF6036 family nucleotidyltransferase [Candidatus Nanopelagicales bacterium]